MDIKPAILEALRKFARQRPGLEYGNYGDPVAYRAEMRQITRDLADAQTLLKAVEWSGIDADALIRAADGAFSGRLTIKVAGDVVGIGYCTGQYWPTEYRQAVCAVLASALWARWRDHLPGEVTGDRIRKMARDEFGCGIASRWFR